MDQNPESSLSKHFIKFDLNDLQHTLGLVSGFSFKFFSRDLNNVKGILRCAGVHELDLYCLSFCWRKFCRIVTKVTFGRIFIDFLAIDGDAQRIRARPPASKPHGYLTY